MATQKEQVKVKVFYALLYGCGLRTGEALNLLNDDSWIDLKHGQIHLHNRPATQEIPPFLLKDKEARTIPIPRAVLEMLIQLKKETDPDCPFILLTKERWGVVQNTWQKMKNGGRAREWQDWRLVCNPLRA